MSALLELTLIHRAKGCAQNGSANRKWRPFAQMLRLSGLHTWFKDWTLIQQLLQSGACTWKCLTECFGRLRECKGFVNLCTRMMWRSPYLTALRWKKRLESLMIWVVHTFTPTKRFTICSSTSARSNLTWQLCRSRKLITTSKCFGGSPSTSRCSERGSILNSWPLSRRTSQLALVVLDSKTSTSNLSASEQKHTTLSMTYTGFTTLTLSQDANLQTNDWLSSYQTRSVI